MGGTAAKFGVAAGFTVTVIVVVEAQLTDGVKVYKVVAFWLNEGVHTPGIPLFETAGNVTLVPAQMGGCWVKAGTTFALTVTGIVKGPAAVHCPGLGVKT